MFTVKSSTTVANVTDLRRKSGEIFERIEKGDRVLIQKNTDPVAMLVDFHAFNELLEASERLQELEDLMEALIREDRIEAGEDDTTSHAEMLERFELGDRTSGSGE